MPTSDEIRDKDFLKKFTLKLTGEAIGKKGINVAKVEYAAGEIAAVCAGPLREISIVVGGGNIVRGRELSAYGIREEAADYMGMTATIINAIILQETLEGLGVQTRIMTASDYKAVAEPYIRRRAIRHLGKERVVILAGGIGSPGFSTDMAAIVRAKELGANAVLKGTTVAGVYDKDPKKKNAKLLPEISNDEALARHLAIMDAAALAHAGANKIPIIVFNFFEQGNLQKLVTGANIGSIICD
ncbi:uridine monophosphate kinase [Patescibacteria group bacterium]